MHLTYHRIALQICSNSSSKHQTNPDERSVNDSKCRFMSDACLTNNNNCCSSSSSSSSSNEKKIDSINGELSFWTPAAFQLFAKTLSNEWQRNCRWTTFWVHLNWRHLVWMCLNNLGNCPREKRRNSLSAINVRILLIFYFWFFRFTFSVLLVKEECFLFKENFILGALAHASYSWTTMIKWWALHRMVFRTAFVHSNVHHQTNCGWYCPKMFKLIEGVERS